ncbi:MULTISPECIES: ATP-binding protein [unclassified Roseofilum]|uniref:ATP-binding protein n=1 Tax=unclassified Roseofilum TaxID=2620099 RepID=UPI000E90065E|nr:MULTISPECIES: ATP-binding protein [unclassified Roseofilum]MBP0007037.1 PAS domain-containing protein [Roseofilum sp. Belize Diploria]MBP0031545.1 PAS domain-containing protein [Roseofilum sp. Belize BBD 4]HBQ99888.1 histidine kinase [Cyanobacteria bacterium UBA11691]
MHHSLTGLLAPSVNDPMSSDRPQFDLALPSSKEGLWDWNLPTGRIFFNTNWQKILGFSESELPQTFSEFEALIHSEDLPIHQAALQAHIQGGTEFYESTYRLHCPSGGYRWILARGLCYRYSDGTPYRLAGSHTDVTSFKKAQEQESVLRLITDQIRSSLNLKTIWKTAVDQIQKLLDADRVLIYQFEPNWKGSVIVEKVVGNWGSTLGEVGADDCFSQDYAKLYKNGRVRVIHDILTSHLDECHVNFLQKFDVRSNLIVPIIIKEELWGLLIAHECKRSRRWKESEVTLLSHVAKQLAIAIYQANLYDQSQQAVQESEEKAHELELALLKLQKTQAQLIESEKQSSIGQLVAGIAHEINNPVSFIYGNIDFAKAYLNDLLELVQLYQNTFPEPGNEIEHFSEDIDLEFLQDDCMDLLDSMKNGASRIREIVLFLRTFSRLDEAQMKRVNLHDGIESTLMIVNHRLQKNGNRPMIEVCKNYGVLPPVECYAGQLNQVFMNILVNAIDAIDSAWEHYSNRDSPEIRITTEDWHMESVKILITDNGVGMSDLIRQRLFTPFYSTKPVGKGKGLGLSLCHAIIVDHHGGKLSCDSEPGKGTTFIIELPLHQS